MFSPQLRLCLLLVRDQQSEPAAKRHVEKLLQLIERYEIIRMYHRVQLPVPLAPSRLMEMGERAMAWLEKEKDKPLIVLMGDSILDAHYQVSWKFVPRTVTAMITGPTTLRKELSKNLKEEYGVVNLAYENSSFFDFAMHTVNTTSRDNDGDDHNYFFVNYAKADISSPSQVFPLDVLAFLKNPRFIIISLGLNDIYLRLETMLRGVATMDAAYDEYKKNVQSIVEQVMERQPRASVILVIPFLPGHAQIEAVEKRFNALRKDKSVTFEEFYFQIVTCIRNVVDHVKAKKPGKLFSIDLYDWSLKERPDFVLDKQIPRMTAQSYVNFVKQIGKVILGRPSY